ncbi:MAG: hypothetical protein ABIK85_05705 [Candidatus Eisenbacteria bacterium]
MSEPGHPSTSAEQQTAEALIRSALSRQLAVSFSAPPASLAGLKLDAFATGPPPVLVEIFARVGKSKSGQMRKLSRDMAKLLLAERRLAKACRKVLAVIDPDAVAHFENGWDGEFAKTFGIELVVVAVDEGVRSGILAAQKRQFR